MTDVLKQQIAGLLTAGNSRYATYDGQLDALQQEAEENADTMASYLGAIEDALDEEKLYTVSQLQETWNIGDNQYLILSDGSNIKATDLFAAVIQGRDSSISSGNVYSNIAQEITINTYEGVKTTTLESIHNDVNDQYEDSVIRIQAIKAAIRGEYDKDQEIVKSDVSGYASLISATMDTSSARTRDIISYYSDAIAKPCDRFTLISRLRQVYENFTFGNDSSTGFTYNAGDSSYTGCTSFSAWLSGIDWPDHFSVSGVVQGCKVIIQQWWKLSIGQMGFQKKARSWLRKKFIKPFKKPTELFLENNRFTTDFLDLPCFQVFITGAQTARWMSVLPEDSILCFEIFGVRISVWKYIDENNVTKIAAQVNVSPVAPDISGATIPLYNTSTHEVEGSYYDFIYNTSFPQLPLESKSDYRKGLCTNLFLADLFAKILIVQYDPLYSSINIDKEINNDSPDQYVLPYFVKGASSSASSRHGTYGMFNGMLSQFCYIGNITSTATPDNNDIFRYVSGGNGMAYVNGEEITAASAWVNDNPISIINELLEAYYQATINGNDLNDSGIVVYKADSLGTPRFTLASDPTGSDFEMWLVAAAVIVAAVVIIAKSPKMLAKRRNRKARIEADEWRCMTLLSENPVGSEGYQEGLDLYAKVCKRRFIANMFATGSSNATAACSQVSDYVKNKTTQDTTTVTTTVSNDGSSTRASVHDSTTTSNLKFDQIINLIK